MYYIMKKNLAFFLPIFMIFQPGCSAADGDKTMVEGQTHTLKMEILAEGW